MKFRKIDSTWSLQFILKGMSLLLIAMVHFEMYAQVAVIGSGGSTSTLGSNAGPIFRSSAPSTFDYSHHYYLYTAAELTAAGITQGSTITAIAWNKANSLGTVAANTTSDFIIHLKNTSAVPGPSWCSSSYATQSSGATMVYNNTDQVIPLSSGYITFTLTTPFVYTGGSLEIGTNWNCSQFLGNPTTGGFSWKQDAISNQVFGASGSSSSLFMTLQSYRPQIQITYTAVSPPPGIYPSTSLVCGSNAIVLPSAPPANAIKAFASTNTNFTGTLTVNPTSGTVYVTNAKPAGNYLITINTFDTNSLASTSTFTLTVTDPLCSQAQFTQAPNATFIGSAFQDIATGDFDKNGIQDIIIVNSSPARLEIKLGNGDGTFSFGPTPYLSITGSHSCHIADINGDGNQDIAANISNAIRIFFGDGLGNFPTQSDVSAGLSPLSVACGDVNNDGKPDLVISNYISNSVSIRLGDGSGGFTGTIDVPVGIGTHGIALADFNNDNKIDFATANFNSHNISIRFGNGDGSFSIPTSPFPQELLIPANGKPRYLTIGDINKDGLQDIVVASNDNHTVSIFKGDLSSGFLELAGLTLTQWPTSVKVDLDDFNGDSHLDVLVSCVFPTVFIGDGQGNFSYLGYANSYGGAAGYAAYGDFNNDHILDVTMSEYYGNCGVSLGGLNEANIRGNNINIIDGDISPSLADYTAFGSVNVNGAIQRTFTLQNIGNTSLTINSIIIAGNDATSFTLGGIALPINIQAGDSVTFTVTFTDTIIGLRTATVIINNNDCDEGVYDFAIQANVLSSGMLPTIGIYPNSTVIAGRNTSILPSTAPFNTSGMIAFSNTNFTGILTADPLTGIVSVTDAKQAGTYLITVQAFQAGGLTATTTFTLHVVDPDCSAALFSSSVISSAGITPYGISIGDFNQDGNQDLAVANANDESVSIKLGDGSGGLLLNQPANVMVGNGPFHVAVGDFNGDGKQDIATANNYAYTVSIKLGNGDGTFYGNTVLSVGEQPEFVAIGDFNNDGKQDLAITNFEDDNISIRMGDGNGGFTTKPDVNVGIGPIGLIVGDFDKDGFQDLASANWNSDNVSIRFGTGSGTFTGSTNVAVMSKPNSIAIADFNGDGNQDFVVACFNDSKASVRLGSANGVFNSGNDYTAALTPYGVAVGDVNGDGNQDFLIADNYSNFLPLYLGNGNGTFNAGTSISTNLDAIAIAVGDFNNDNHQDIATANSQNNSASIILGLADVPEINVSGNSVLIVDGSQTSGIYDHTNFGDVNSGSSVARTFTIHNTGNTNLTIYNINIIGIDAALFNIGGIAFPAIIAPNSSVTFTVAFTSTIIGLKTATVHIDNNDCDEGTYDFTIQANVINPVMNLTLSLFIECYYAGGNVMVPALLNQGVSSNPAHTDSLLVELHTVIAPYSIVDSVKGILSTNGAVGVNLSVPNGSYYIVIKHRNGIQTWSANPLLFNGSPVFYDFTSADSQAYGSNQVEVSPGVWAIYSGDINQDENIDLLDLGIAEADIQDFLYGYFPTDINGDGNVDLLDLPIMEENANNFIFSSHP